MSPFTKKTRNVVTRLAPVVLAVAALLFAVSANAAVPGITSNSAPSATSTFNLAANADYISQPDGAMIWSWGYGCLQGSSPTYSPFSGRCPVMQVPGPTMIVTEGQVVSVTLTNNLPAGAGNTSILFPGFQVATSGGVAGLQTQEAAPGATVTYTFTAVNPGTYSYYSGTRPELQIEMGMYGAVVVLPATPQANCKSKGSYSLAANAYDHPQSCYDREYLFQFAEIDARVHRQALTQSNACAAALAANQTCAPIAVVTEPYHPQYFLINGRSMPDDMDADYAPGYPNQPYNGNPHMHPGELVLMRVVGQGRWQHPFHFHGNHARVLARDGNLILSSSPDPAFPTAAKALAGPLLFTIPTVSGQTVDAIFTWTGQGLNWDVYGTTNPHTCNGHTLAQGASAGFDATTHEYCPDHGKAMPVTPPDSNILANGLWYGGSPYMGLQANNPTPLPPGSTSVSQNQNGAYAYMWHSHNEREITTNDVFPGGMMMMLIIDPPGASIDETQ
jgi:FtsP/CotA-like multicopper oxidase with cupredoxin domain